MIIQWIRKILGRGNFNSGKYWENRYLTGGNSGDGSYGRLADFKASFINNFIDAHKIYSALEFGCGDGNQLSLIHYPSYTGLDVSATIIDKCTKRFSGDNSKKFIVYRPGKLQNLAVADLTLSLDVIYHITEDATYKQYIQDLVNKAGRYIVIYSTDFDQVDSVHVRHRKFTDALKNYPDWKLLEKQANPFAGTEEQQSNADFFVYEKHHD